MNVLVIGLGSMGKRRIKLLRQLFSDLNIYGVETNDKRRFSVANEFGIEIYSTVESALKRKKYNCAFVCSAPLSHAEIIRVCLVKGLNVFTELNLVSDGYEDNISLAKEKDCTLFLSSTFLYREEVRFIINRIRKSQFHLSYMYHVGQYLPDWHSWECYKDFFIGDRRTNGCREIFAIELPWLIKAFGHVKKFHIWRRNMSNLNLDYPDHYLVAIEHESGHWGQLSVDVVTQVPVRRLEVFGEDTQIYWYGVPEHLYVLDNGKMRKIDPLNQIERETGYRDFIVENAYIEELREFFSACAGNTSALYDFSDDLYTLSLIDRFEQGDMS